MAKEIVNLVKVDHNGTKYYEGYVPCDRCGGMGESEAWKFTGLTCYKCGGTGEVYKAWKEFTPEHEAELEKRRLARLAKKNKEHEAEMLKLQKEIEEQKAREEAEQERIKAEKAMSQYIGNIGDKIKVHATYIKTAFYSFRMGWMEQTMYVHTFKDESGNTLVWKTSSNSLPDLEEGMKVELSGTIKEHSEYKEEKQTSLIRCKVKELEEA